MGKWDDGEGEDWPPALDEAVDEVVDEEVEKEDELG